MKNKIHLLLMVALMGLMVGCSTISSSSIKAVESTGDIIEAVQKQVDKQVQPGQKVGNFKFNLRTPWSTCDVEVIEAEGFEDYVGYKLIKIVKNVSGINFGITITIENRVIPRSKKIE